MSIFKFNFNKFEIFFIQILLGMFLTTISFYVESMVGPHILTAGIPMGMWIVCLSPVTFVVMLMIENQNNSQKSNLTTPT